MTAGAPAAVTEHWWSPAPVPLPAVPISARRAYTEVIGVYLAFFGPSIIAAASTLTSLQFTNPEGWWVTGSDGLNELTQAGLAVVVVVLLAGRRGRVPADVGLVASRARGGPGLSAGIRMAAWAASALVVGSIVTSVLATGSFPFGHHTAANTILDLSAALNAGVVEELVVLGFLVTTLEQAGRPRVEIAVVALVCRGAYHIYYGPGAIGILVWAATFLWLFWRFRSLVPMVIVHTCWDTFVFLGALSHIFSGLLILAILGLIATAVVLWLSDRSPPTLAHPPTSGSPRGAVPPHWGPPAPSRLARPDDGAGWGPPADR